MIPQQDIDALKQRVKIEDILVHLNMTTCRRGSRTYTLCPFHDDHHPSMLIDLDRGGYYCPVCNTHGDSISLLMKSKNLTYIEALKQISGIYGITLHEEDKAPNHNSSQMQTEWVRSMRKQIADYAASELFKADNQVLSYLHTRGFSDDTLHTYQVGYLPPHEHWDGQHQSLHSYKEAFSLQGRIIFPWKDRIGNIIGLAGRVLNPATKGVEVKYKNSSFRKGNYFFGWPEAATAMRKSHTAYIVEGYTDVMAMHQSDITNVIAQCGTAMTDQHAQLLASTISKVVLCLDNDDAGIIAMEQAALKLLPYNLDVEILLAKNGCDPADMLLSEGESCVKEWAQTTTLNILDLCIHKIQQTPITDVYRLRGRIRQLTTYLSLITDSILHELYIGKCCELIPSLTLDSLRKDVIAKQMDIA